MRCQPCSASLSPPSLSVNSSANICHSIKKNRTPKLEKPINDSAESKYQKYLSKKLSIWHCAPFSEGRT